ncbi:MAG: dipeptidase [Gammaproteobacteria bacterium]|nr:MAG: dipeptidase [Gammaproteobacteria bacterium]
MTDPTTAEKPFFRAARALLRRLSGVLAVSALASGAHAAQCAMSDVPEADARALQSRVLSIDTHVDIGIDYATWKLDPGGFTRAQHDLPKMRAGGLDAVFLIVFTQQGALDEEGFQKARDAAEDKYQAIMRLVRAYPDQVGLATTPDEVRSLHARGKRTVLLGMENAYPLGNSVGDVALWAGRGVRYVGLTHMGHNQFGGSSNPNPKAGDAPDDPGLTAAGKELVRALNDHGVMVDVSHVGRRTMLEATRLSRAPVIASHSSAMGVHDNARNLDDEQLDAIRDSGGVAQMVAYRDYVAEVDPAFRAGAQELLKKHLPDGWAGAKPEQIAAFSAAVLELRQKFPDVTVAQFADHIDYAVKRIGIEHVGIASDFDGGGGVKGWDDAAQTVNVTRELMRRCYTEKQIKSLWGGNLLRVLGEVQARARGQR